MNTDGLKHDPLEDHPRLRRAAANNFQLELNEPPDGISIAGIAQGDAEMKIMLHSDAARIKPGVTGNLIVNIMAKRQRANAAAGKARGNQQRVALGSLPAIPFEIVASRLLVNYQRTLSLRAAWPGFSNGPGVGFDSFLLLPK